MFDDLLLVKKMDSPLDFLEDLAISYVHAGTTAFVPKPKLKSMTWRQNPMAIT
jgi:hypothetical protein